MFLSGTSKEEVWTGPRRSWFHQSPICLRHLKEAGAIKKNACRWQVGRQTDKQQKTKTSKLTSAWGATEDNQISISNSGVTGKGFKIIGAYEKALCLKSANKFRWHKVYIGSWPSQWWIFYLLWRAKGSLSARMAYYIITHGWLVLTAQTSGQALLLYLHLLCLYCWYNIKADGDEKIGNFVT